jgi:hypothetical protein
MKPSPGEKSEKGRNRRRFVNLAGESAACRLYTIGSGLRDKWAASAALESPPLRPLARLGRSCENSANWRAESARRPRACPTKRQAASPVPVSFSQMRILRGWWGRLSTCGGLATRPEALENRQARRRLTTGAQDAILPHDRIVHSLLGGRRSQRQVVQKSSQVLVDL